MGPTNRNYMTQILIDGNNIANRVFFAFKDLSVNINGQITNSGVIYGFTKFVINLGLQYNTPNIFIAWDSGSSDRKKLYPEYKSGRDHSHYSDMISQMDDLCLLLSVMNITQVRADGYEADDVIYTLINTLPDGLKVIFSSDKDMTLFLRDDVIIHRPGEKKIIDSSNIEQIYGVKQEQLLEFFALRGDKVDNIPGVPGIGDKIAKTMLNEAGNITNILQQDYINGVQKSKLKLVKDNIDILNISLQLIKPILIDNKLLKYNNGLIDDVLIDDLLNKYKIRSLNIKSFIKLSGGNNVRTK